MTNEEMTAMRVLIAWWNTEGTNLAHQGHSLSGCAMQFMASHSNFPLNTDTVISILEPLSGQRIDDQFV